MTVEYWDFETHRLIGTDTNVTDVPKTGDSTTFLGVDYVVKRRLRDDEHNTVALLVTRV